MKRTPPGIRGHVATIAMVVLAGAVVSVGCQGLLGLWFAATP